MAKYLSLLEGASSSPAAATAWWAGVVTANPKTERHAFGTVTQIVAHDPSLAAPGDLAGIGEIWLDGEAAPVLPASPAGMTAHVTVVEERVEVPCPTADGVWTGLKRVTFVRRKPDVTRDAWRGWYFGGHSERARAMGLAGYVINILPEDADLPYDAIPMFWFVDEEQHRAAYDASQPQVAARSVDALPWVVIPATYLVTETVAQGAAQAPAAR